MRFWRHLQARPQMLVTHGIHYSHRTKRLYAVNHVEASGESVEVFSVIGADSWDELKLKHVLTIHSPLFKRFALNDVVEVWSSTKK